MHHPPAKMQKSAVAHLGRAADFSVMMGEMDLHIVSPVYSGSYTRTLAIGVAAAIIDKSNTAPSYGVTVAVAFCAPLRENIRAILVTEPTCSKRIGQ